MTTLTADITMQIDAQAAFQTDTQSKDAERKALLDTLAVISNTVSANTNVTNPILTALAFAPRRVNRPTPRPLVRPTDLVAAPNSDDTVRLSWDRPGNAKTTIFVVEASADGTAWSQIKSLTRTRHVAEGFPAGTAAYFRVTATNSTQASTPSLTVSAYLPSVLAFHLHVA